jgi:hypothetical protein
MISSTRRLSGRLAISAASANAVTIVLLFLSGCSGDEPIGLKQIQAANAASSRNEEGASQGPEVAHLARNYAQLRLVTKTPVEVDQHFALLCIGIQQVHVDEARKRAGPHALTAIRIFMNDLAYDAFHKVAATYPVGSVIVKEKRGLEYFLNTSSRSKATTPDGVGGMIKRAPGFDPDHGDWEYFYFDDEAKIESGRIANCVQCHQAAAATDRVFGDWAKKQ